MEVAALVVAIAAVLISAAALGYARRSANASKRSASAAERSVDAAQEAVGYERERAERSRVVFELDRISKYEYALRNTGTDTAYAVHIDTGNLGIHDQETDFDEFPSDHAEPVTLLETYGPQTTHVVVTWHHQPDRSDEQRLKRLHVQ